MVSDQLTRLREMTAQQREVYATVRTKARQIRQNMYVGQGTRQYELTKMVGEAQAALNDLAKQQKQAADEISKRANARNIKGTPEARAKVVHALEHGFTYDDLVEQLTSEGDRVALASLHDYLPYAARAGYLIDAKGRGDYKDMVEHAKGVLNRHESKLWDENEQRAREEQQAVDMGLGYLQENHEEIGKWLNTQHLPNEALSGRGIEHLWHFGGLPGDDQPKGMMSIEEGATV